MYYKKLFLLATYTMLLLGLATSQCWAFDPPEPSAPEPSLAALLLVAGVPAYLAYRKRKRS